MSARMELHVALSLRLDAIVAHRLANAYRVEVLREAVNKLDEKILAIAVGYGPPEQQPDGRVSGLCAAVGILRRMAEGAGQAGKDTASSGESTQPANFFQPGRTYRKTLAVSTWLYLCEHITTDPNNGERISLGWHRRLEDDNPAWFPKLPLRQDEWHSGKWAEAPDGGDAR